MKFENPILTSIPATRYCGLSGHFFDMSEPKIAVRPIAGQEQLTIRQPVGKIETITKPQQQIICREQDKEDATLSPRKKSLSFKLTFSGLALVLLVFQLDATCLSIALPVSTEPPFSITTFTEHRSRLSLAISKARVWNLSGQT